MRLLGGCSWCVLIMSILFILSQERNENRDQHFRPLAVSIVIPAQAGIQERREGLR